MDILARILEERRQDAQTARAKTPIEELHQQASDRAHHSLAECLRSHDGTGIIAEMKRASPSAGLLRETYEPERLAQVYRESGAVGISVLTEPRHFQGSGEHLRCARAAVELPILRKDFLCDPYQIAEAAAWGADVVLLIVAALEGAALRMLHAEAVRLGLDVLVEAHTAAELERALALDPAIVGINSRDLKTLRTDLAVAERLAKRIPPDRIAIAESGIRTRDDIERLQAVGYRGFLIGESLLREGDPGAKLAELTRKHGC